MKGRIGGAMRHVNMMIGTRVARDSVWRWRANDFTRD